MKVNVNITLEFQIKKQKKVKKKYQYVLKNTGIRKFVYKIYNLYLFFICK